MKTVFISMLTLVLSFSGLKAQNFKFGKVSAEEIKESSHPLEKDAEAAFLYNYRNTYFMPAGDTYTLITEVHQRIKIYSKEGFDYATQSIYLRKGNDGDDIVTGLKATTYNLVDGKIEEMKMEKDAVFNESISKYRDKRSFTLPGVKEGSVLEIRYKISSPYFFNIAEFNLQYGIPVNELQMHMSAPEYFKFKPTFKGYMAIAPKVERFHDPATQLISVRNTFELKNVPAMKAEDYVDNISNYRAAYSFELNIIDVPGRYFKNFSQTWDDVAKTINKSDDFKNELDKTGYYKDEIDPLLAQMSSPEQKIAGIFRFVVNRMNWNEYYGFTCDKGVRKAYDDRTGNVADINLMLTSMLRYAGLEAHPVLVSTKSYGIPLYPTVDGFNYVISAVKFGGGYVLLDATEKYLEPNVLPLRARNWNGTLIRPDGSTDIVDLSSRQVSKEVVSVQVNLEEDGSAEGKVRYQATLHKALSHRESYLNMNQEQYLESREKEFNGIEISDYERQGWETPGEPLLESFNFSKEAITEGGADRLVFSPLLFMAKTNNPFVSEKRDYPVDFGFPANTRLMVSINLPEGYQVTYIPENVTVSLPDGLAKFSYQLMQNQNTLQLLLNSEINTDIVSQQYYDYLRQYFDTMAKKHGEQVILTKA